jgi:hypothetical protein
VSADVEVCAGPSAPPYTFAFPSYFQLHFADGGAIGSYGSRKKPTLEKTPLKSGQCARGWLDFAVVSGQKPVAIHYHEAEADKKPIEWPVNQAWATAFFQARTFFTTFPRTPVSRVFIPE